MFKMLRNSDFLKESQEESTTFWRNGNFLKNNDQSLFPQEIVDAPVAEFSEEFLYLCNYYSDATLWRPVKKMVYIKMLQINFVKILVEILFFMTSAVANENVDQL